MKQWRPDTFQPRGALQGKVWQLLLLRLHSELLLVFLWFTEIGAVIAEWRPTNPWCSHCQITKWENVKNQYFSLAKVSVGRFYGTITGQRDFSLSIKTALHLTAEDLKNWNINEKMRALFPPPHPCSNHFQYGHPTLNHCREDLGFAHWRRTSYYKRFVLVDEAYSRCQKDSGRFVFWENRVIVHSQKAKFHKILLKYSEAL